MREAPSHVDLFSGQGGFALAAEWAGFETVVFCEIDNYCQRILAKNFGAILPNSDSGQRIESKREIQTRRTAVSGGGETLPNANAFGRNGRSHNEGKAPAARARPKIISDIRDFDGREYRGCDLLTGGFPCQPFSVAGKRRGAADDRNLWPEMLRVIKESQPTWIIGENVPGIETMEFRRLTTRVEDHSAMGNSHEEVHIYCESTVVLDACVREGLESLGYEVQPLCIPACGVDARHRRDRIWIVAYSESARLERLRTNSGKPKIAESRNGGALADTGEQSFEGRSTRTRRRRREYEETSQVGRGERRQSDVVWLPEPGLGRVAHGVPYRVDRLKALGNAIVPQEAYEIIYEIRELIYDRG